VYLYHIPQNSGVAVGPELVGRLLERFGAKIRGYKDSSGQWANTAEIRARFPQLETFVGFRGAAAQQSQCRRRRLHLGKRERAAGGDARALRQLAQRAGRLAPGGGVGRAQGARGRRAHHHQHQGGHRGPTTASRRGPSRARRSTPCRRSQREALESQLRELKLAGL